MSPETLAQRSVAPAAKDRDAFRRYDGSKASSVRRFYRQNHRFQTFDFASRKRDEYGRLDRRRMSILEALDFLDTLVDESDPDLDLGQRQHGLQTAEALRADGHEDWLVLIGLVHDLGKVLCLFGEPQWAVVGDTFPVGCAFSDRVVHAELFAENPDRVDPRFASRCGIYEEGCGLRNVCFSWGHDEYLSQVLRDHVPEKVATIVRTHSFYAWHREGEYDWLCDARDREMLPWVQRFNSYDLYSKSPDAPDWEALRPYYAELIDRLLPPTLRF